MPQAGSKLQFFFEVPADIRHRARLKKFIQEIFRSEKTPLDKLNYIFTSDKKLLELNKKFLKHNYFTDVLSFDLSEGSAVNAEVYISIDRVRENARLEKTSFKQEILRVMIHGALHLCGYRDKTQKEQKLIRQAENIYLQRVTW